ncbi:MAG: protein kinase [candidate division Zixibacteria bacterium]|nr:protein kinase [candidate division Zixibacteria bacterium]
MSDSKDNINKNNSDKNHDSQIDDETKSVDSSFSSGKPDSHHPNKIGQYHIKRVIASGGMGTVFEALQENPKRPVAVKVVKSNLESESAVRRLEYEAQMLARLRHPGIAQIYEAGSYDDNGTQTPFFAMEYIPNAKSIIEYSLENNLSDSDRITLFLQVCDAIHHGHQRGIVHRDLKPSNILVDSSGRVRIIDFGVARATDADMKQAAGITNYGQIVGTIQYMSPEQFDADPHDIDIRSDVYALGFVLYELLTDCLPYSVSTDNIFDFATEVREGKSIPIGTRNSSFKGDLEAIIQMAMHRDREQRYQSAYGLAQDIRRFINGDAVVATKPGLGYQIRIFTRKNKLVIGLVAAVFALLLTSVIVTSSLLVTVEQESGRVKKANDFMVNIFEQGVPYGFGKPVPISRLLDESTELLKGAFPNEPEIESDIRHALGIGYFWCEKNDDARINLDYALELRKKALGDLHHKTKETLEALDELNTITGDFQENLGVCKEICRIDSTNFGIGNETTVRSRINVAGALADIGKYSDALKLIKNTKQDYLAENSGDIKIASRIDVSLSRFYLENGLIEEAKKIARANYEISCSKIEESWYIEKSKSTLAAALIAQGKLEEAKELYGNYPTYDGLDREYNIRGDFNQGQSDLHLMIFWEEWCPYCDKMMRKVEKLYRLYKNDGLNAVGITNFWQSTTRELSEKFIDNYNISFPIIKEGGAAIDHFNVNSVPAIRLIYKGYLIWDHQMISSEPISKPMLEGIIKHIQASK